MVNAVFVFFTPGYELLEFAGWIVSVKQMIIAYKRTAVNDDDEFATLTSMDAVMLQILYNPRLLPGMTLDQARPYLYEISELLNKPQS